jgi:hypothetical protein
MSEAARAWLPLSIPTARYSTHGILYPRLYTAEPGVDHSRFDRFHVNVSGDGTGVDELAQLLRR